ncbi:MAG: FG-GAP repeat protein [Gemmatimonadales bacterium]|nr:FG-GAP repeat protein [Gemmatimonadales bacterium]
MSGPRGCNQRAVFLPIILISTLLCLVATAGGAVNLSYQTGGAGQEFATSMDALHDNAGNTLGLLVGVPGDPGGAGNGAVMFWEALNAVTVDPDQIWTGAPNEHFGWCVAAIGDVNDDGWPDWAVGAPQPEVVDNLPGKVYVFFGADILPSSPDKTFTGGAAADQFGYSVAAAGDFNGDGIDDFIVGAPYYDTGGSDRGAAYVIYGQNSTGPSEDLADATILTGEFGGNHFGWSVTGAGNFLGGSAECVAVGAPLNASYWGLQSGAVYVYEGALGGGDPDSTYDHLITAGEADAYSLHGWVVRGIGRWDSDSYDDLAVGAPMNPALTQRPGRVNVIFGGDSPATTADRYVTGEMADDQFGYAIAGVGDVVGSSYEDLLIGAPFRDLDGMDSGRAYIFPGGSSTNPDASDLALTIDSEDWLQPGARVGDQFGFAVSSAGDFDGDGSADYAVGAPQGNILSNATAGFCRVVDSGGLAVASILSQWDARWSADEGVRLEFRFELARMVVEDIRLIREDLDSGGRVISRTDLWRGPVVPLPSFADSHPSGVLYGLDSGFLFVDQSPPVGVGSMRYDLTVNHAGGGVLNFTALAGPEFMPPADPVVLEMAPAWPNPFNPSTQVKFKATVGREVRCRVSDLRGRRVRDLYTGLGTGRWQTLTWDGLSDDGRAVASGMYLIRLDTSSNVVTRRVVLTK